MAQVRRSKKPVTSGSRFALAQARRDGGKLSIVHPSGGWGKAPHASTNETCTSDGLGFGVAAARSPAVASNVSEVSLASGLGDDADVGLRGRPALRIDLL